jgi:hypothetical protein
MTDDPKKKWSTGKVIIVTVVALVLLCVVIPCVIGMLMPATPQG